MPDSILPDYTFLPWLKKGMGNKIEEPETSGAPVEPGAAIERAKINVKLNITGQSAGGPTTIPIDKEINLIGPGDIVGVNTSAIVKNDPKDKTTDFEPNYLANIQFYDEDFAWRYTPAKANANGQLRPWLFLVVLKESEFSFEDPTYNILPSITILDAGATATFLPKHTELAAWAHVHINDKLGDTETEDHLVAVSNMEARLAENPNLGTCRIMCPRKLEANTNYHAFVIPTYETGRLAGLGVDPAAVALIPAQTASWGTAHAADAEPNRFPIYHNWSFDTGEGGDFEHLVRLLKPQPVDNQVGRRPMDLQDAGFGLNYETDIVVEGETVVKTTLSLEGALTVPESEGEAYPYPENDGADFRRRLQDLVNMDEDLKAEGDLDLTDNIYALPGEEAVFGGGVLNDDPIVTPPLYGRWHFLEKKANINNDEADAASANWFHELNLDPRNRVIAAVGTNVIQESQDVFMHEAWEQMGDVIDTNKKVHWAQLSSETSNALFKKHISSQPNEKALALTGKMKRRLKNVDTGKTYYQEEKESKLPLAVEDKSFRRIMRPAGPIMKKIDPSQLINKTEAGHDLVNRLDNAGVTAAINKAAPHATWVTVSTLLPMDGGIVSGVGTALYNFNLTGIGDTGMFTIDNTTEANPFRTAIDAYTTYFNADNWETPEAKVAFEIEKAIEIKAAIEPRKTQLSRVYKTIISDGPGEALERIVPAMAHPIFNQPMYEAVRDLDHQLLIPNLNLVPTNSISLLQTNPKFIESYMVGLNHEMGRELLWREYPTDQRGTYFQQFWNPSDNLNSDGLAADLFEESNYDITKIHTWTKTTNLGTHKDGGETVKPVLLIRGDLLRKYPNAVIYAIKAEWQEDEGTGLPIYTLPRRPKTGTEVYPMFNAKIDPDITFFGFDLTIPESKGDDPAALQVIVDDTIAAAIEAGTSPIIAVAGLGVGDPGYFFVLKERPGEARFALDVDPGDDPDLASWNDLHWGKLSSTETIGLTEFTGAGPADAEDITWDANMNAAEMAMVLYQNPVMVCVHAREMLESAE
ncbi:MAG: hypothetical protein GQ574_01140 [Crocinitomix sp.]|nr:hypothetical protein [Crocinitomix sp.]